VFHLLQVEGTIPGELVGTYFRNGPGMQVRKQHAGRALPQQLQ
jgi:carotenoid cleavage dioxygenase-like enzyme